MLLKINVIIFMVEFIFNFLCVNLFNCLIIIYEWLIKCNDFFIVEVYIEE